MAVLPFDGTVIGVVGLLLALVVPLCHTRTERGTIGIQFVGLLTLVVIAGRPELGYTLTMALASGVVVAMALAFLVLCVHVA
jgi:preprotein translocase subunit SecD